MMYKNKGFNLVELMVVVAIIGVIASIALPAFQGYLARAQVNEAVILTGGIKAPITAYFQNVGAVPSIKDVNGISSGKYVHAITIIDLGTNGLIIEATMKHLGVNSKIQGKIFGLESNDGGTSWLCGDLATHTANNLALKYLPSSCK